MESYSAAVELHVAFVLECVVHGYSQLSQCFCHIQNSLITTIQTVTFVNSKETSLQ